MTIPFGLDIVIPAKLTIGLIGFPSATSAVFETEIIYRECLPANYVSPFIQDQSLTVGDERRELDVIFDQTPCDFTQTYIAVIVDSDGVEQEDLPVFLYIDRETGVFTIDETKSGDDGEYMIKVYSLIENYAKDRLSTEFKVTVVPKSPFVPEFKPIWEPKLATQRLKVGDDLEYEPVFNVVKYDYIYTLKVRLNRIALFGSYDEESNLLTIDGDKVSI